MSEGNPDRARRARSNKTYNEDEREAQLERDCEDTGDDRYDGGDCSMVADTSAAADSDAESSGDTGSESEGGGYTSDEDDEDDEDDEGGGGSGARRQRPEDKAEYVQALEDLAVRLCVTPDQLKEMKSRLRPIWRCLQGAASRKEKLREVHGCLQYDGTPVTDQQLTDIIEFVSTYAEEICIPDQAVAQAFATVSLHNGGVWATLSRNLRTLFATALMWVMADKLPEFEAQGPTQYNRMLCILASIGLGSQASGDYARANTTDTAFDSAIAEAKAIAGQLNELGDTERLQVIFGQLASLATKCTPRTRQLRGTGGDAVDNELHDALQTLKADEVAKQYGVLRVAVNVVMHQKPANKGSTTLKGGEPDVPAQLLAEYRAKQGHDDPYNVKYPRFTGYEPLIRPDNQPGGMFKKSEWQREAKAKFPLPVVTILGQQYPATEQEDPRGVRQAKAAQKKYMIEKEEEWRKETKKEIAANNGRRCIPFRAEEVIPAADAGPEALWAATLKCVREAPKMSAFFKHAYPETTFPAPGPDYKDDVCFFGDPNNAYLAVRWHTDKGGGKPCLFGRKEMGARSMHSNVEWGAHQYALPQWVSVGGAAEPKELINILFPPYHAFQPGVCEVFIYLRPPELEAPPKCFSHQFVRDHQQAFFEQRRVNFLDKRAPGKAYQIAQECYRYGLTETKKKRDAREIELDNSDYEEIADYGRLWEPDIREELKEHPKYLAIKKDKTKPLVIYKKGDYPADHPKHVWAFGDSQSLALAKKRRRVLNELSKAFFDGTTASASLSAEYKECADRFGKSAAAMTGAEVQASEQPAV